MIQQWELLNSLVWQVKGFIEGEFPHSTPLQIFGQDQEEEYIKFNVYNTVQHGFYLMLRSENICYNSVLYHCST